ncbi:MAG: hypothetical protein MRY83_21390 [Flavobacteriales bacterium]|nr:hypothetical protein [Flavobacteriales bacterium]
MTDIKGKIDQKLKEGKAILEHLNVQINLGAMEAEVEFEKQKRNFRKWLDDASAQLDEAIKGGEKELENLKPKLEELRVQAALGKAETRDALKEQQKEMSRSLHNFRQEMKKIYEASQNKWSDFWNSSDDKVNEFHTKFDLFKLQFHLGKKESEEALNEKKKELSKKLEEFKLKLDEKAEVGEEKWDHFTSELSEAWSHLRKAVTGD